MTKTPALDEALRTIGQELGRIKEELVKVNAREDTKLEGTPP